MGTAGCQSEHWPGLSSFLMVRRQRYCISCTLQQWLHVSMETKGFFCLWTGLDLCSWEGVLPMRSHVGNQNRSPPRQPLWAGTICMHIQVFKAHPQKWYLVTVTWTVTEANSLGLTHLSTDGCFPGNLFRTFCSMSLMRRLHLRH